MDSDKRLSQEEIDALFDEVSEAWRQEEEQLEIEFQRKMGNVPPPVPKCTCGAKHTSFPNHHLSWCDLGDNCGK